MLSRLNMIFLPIILPGENWWSKEKARSLPVAHFLTSCPTDASVLSPTNKFSAKRNRR
jgi:hypothetical protein